MGIDIVDHPAYNSAMTDPITSRIVEGADRLLDNLTRDLLGPTAQRIVKGSQHQSLPEAIMADLVDAIPFAGDISSTSRVREAHIRGEPVRRTAPKSLDAVFSKMPGIGPILGAIFPANIITYIEHESATPLDVIRNIPAEIQKLTNTPQEINQAIGEIAYSAQHFPQKAQIQAQHLRNLL